MQTDGETIHIKKQGGSWLEHENCESTDLARFTRRLHQLASKKGFLVQKLGEVGGDPIFLLTPKVANDGSNILIAAGFHGDEPAGCWGVFRFLENVPPDLISGVNLSVLPLVNPTGFRRSKRTNDWGEDPNRGFCHTNSGLPQPSREGLILLEHLPMLKSLAKEGFVSLHEDTEERQFYVYTFENSDAPGALSEALRAEEAKLFEPHPDGMLEGGLGLVRDGIIFRHCDGSFEDLLFHEGIPRTACTETPGLLDINKRVEVNAHIIAAFVRFAIAMHR